MIKQSRKLKELILSEYPLKLIEDLGREYPNKNSRQKARYALFECPNCGKYFKTQTANVRNGGIKSCGCFKKNYSGLTKKYRNIYDRYLLMLRRCYDPQCSSYERYGGRGIQVYKPWRENFELYLNFILSLGLESNPKLQIDRIDNNDGYFPNNIKLSTVSENCQNTRLLSNQNTSGYRGVSKCGDKWRSEIRCNKQYHYLGLYNTPEEGALAYDTFVIENRTHHPLNYPKKDIENV